MSSTSDPGASEPGAPARTSLARSAMSGAAWLSGLNGLAGAALWGLTIWLNRSLDDAPVAMGIWGTVLGVVLMTSLVFEGGIPAAMMQRSDLPRGALAALAWIQILLGLVGFALLLGLAPLLARLWSDFPQDELAGGFRMAAVATLLIALGLPPKAVLQKAMRFRLVAIIESSSTLLLVALGFVLAPGLGLEALVAAIVVRHGVETLLYWTLGSLRPWDLLARFEPAIVSERLRFGASMALQSLLGTAIRQGDRLLVGMLAGPVAAGIYHQVFNLVVQPFAKLAMYVVRAAFPAFALAKDDPARLLGGLTRMQRFLAIATFPMLAGLAAVAPRLLALQLGSQYAPHLDVAVTCLHLLCAGTLVYNYGYGTGVALNAIGLARPMLLRQIAGGVAVILLILAGARWGLVGMSAGRALASIVIAILFLDLARSAVGFSTALMRSTVREALPASLACMAVAASLGWLGDRVAPPGAAGTWSVLAAQVAAGIATYGLVLHALGVRPLGELRALRPRRA